VRFPIRVRLVFWTSSLTLALSLILATFLHYRLSRHLEEDLARYVQYELQEFAEFIEDGCTEARFREFTEHEIKTHPTNLQIFVQLDTDGLGRIFRSGNLDPARLDPPEGEAAEAPRVPRVRRLTTGVGADAVERILGIVVLPVTGEVSPHGRREYRLRMAFDREPLEQILARHRTSIAYAIVAAAILAVSTGWLVASKAMRPVYDLIARAERITAENLREARLPVPGAGDELDRLALVLNTMLERLDGSIRTVQRFTADAAHELRTPLTTIRGELELLQRHPEQFDPAVLDPVLEEIGRLDTLCRRLLLLARLDERARTVERKPTPLHLLLERIIDQVRPLADSQQLRLSIRSEVPVWIDGNDDLLCQAFLNLLDNAIKHTPAHGAVAVAVEAIAQPDSVAVEVRDTGCGIPEEHLPRMFDRFHRIRETEAGEAQGSGLGLAIVKEVVAFHRGTIEVRSAPGRGTTFRLTFPTIPADERILSAS